MFRIGEFSKLSKTTIKALRYYDRVGLLKPAFVDPATAYRYYSQEQLDDLHQILVYKSVGMSNSEILALLSEANLNGGDHAGNERVRDILTRHRAEVSDAVQKLQRQIQEVNRLLESPDGSHYSAELKRIDACTVCYAQGYLPSPASIRSFIQTCHSEFRSVNPQIPYGEPDYCCLIYLGEGYRENNIFVEYAQSVAYAGEEGKIVKFKDLEAMTAVSVVHRGGYDTLRDAYLFGVHWAAQNGYVLQGNARERYIHGSWDCDEESDWITEVQLPIIPRDTENKT